MIGRYRAFAFRWRTSRLSTFLHRPRTGPFNGVAKPGRSLFGAGRPCVDSDVRGCPALNSLVRIVAEAAKKSLGLENVEERVFLIRLILLVTGMNDPSRVAGAGGLQRLRSQALHLPLQVVLPDGGGRRGERLPAPLGGRGHGPCLKR